MNKRKITLKKVVNKKNNDLMFAGAGDLMKKSESEQHQKKKGYILAIAKILNISPLGVTILGGLPYINNLGKKQLTQEKFHKGSSFIYNWVRRSETDDDKAICEVKIVIGKKELTPWVVGECSPGSMKMGTLKGYQNHIAQTRAENRAMQFLDGLKTHELLLKGIAEYTRKGIVTPEESEKLLESVSTASAEEMNTEAKKPEASDQTSTAVNLGAIIQGIYKIKDLKTAQAWLAKINENESLSEQEKTTVKALLENKIKLYKK